MPSVKITHPSSPIAIGLNAVIIAVTEEVPRILIVKRTGHALADPQERQRLATGETLPDALPFGPLEPERHYTLERGLHEWVEQQTGLRLGYVEQLYTFGDRFRDPGERQGEPRVISVAYLALVQEQQLAGAGEAQWQDWYSYFPWEDWRTGRPLLIAQTIQPILEAWGAEAREATTLRVRRERMVIAFGLHGAPWDPERTLERYELLYEAGLVKELYQGPAARGLYPKGPHLGRPMALDHRRILATAFGRVRGKIKYRPVVFELLPPTFTLWQLQRVVESLAGTCLHKQNFRRLVERGGLVEGTGQYDTSTGGRPAERFRFRREVLRERAAPGVGLPGSWRQT
ncbi:hypothetical protein NKDENANG_02919 [Candidatus Entotheonellaceae bacterium PAL068K]